MKFYRKLFPGKKIITASMATVPWRAEALQQVVASLLPQVDRLNIYLNDWEEIPKFLDDPKINAVMSQNESGNLGAKGKFYWCENIHGYHLTVNDDILYPSNYVEEILHGLSRYSKCVVSYHGSILNYPVFKKRNIKLTHFVKNCRKDLNVTLVGTGVLAYDASQLDVKLDIFKSNYWADGWFSLQVRNAGFRSIVLRHKAEWLLPISTEGPDIWSLNRTKSSNNQIDEWINEYKLWDKMTLFSERIRDRNLRWWIHKDEVENKNVSDKLKGENYVKLLGFQTPHKYHIVTTEDFPEFSQLENNFVVKPLQGCSAKNVFIMKNGVNLFDGNRWSRQKIIDELSKPTEIDNANEKIILIEEFLIPWDKSEQIPYDYKFYAFGENIAFCHIINRKSVNTLLNRNWFVTLDFLPIGNQIMVELLHDETLPEKPECWEDLVTAAKVIGGALNRFTRIDLFATDRGVVFGEFTPTPHGGRGFTKWADKWLGEMWVGVEGAGD